MPKTIEVTKTLDACGLICPYPDMDTLATLKHMAKGEILEVFLDYPLSLERIPRNLIKQGHKLLDTQRIEGSKHRMIIEAYGLQE